MATRIARPAVRWLLVAATCGVAAPCSADPLNVLGAFYTISAGTGTTLFEQDLFFAAPRFDSSVGTLDSIHLTVIRGAVNASMTVDSEAPFSAAIFEDDVVASANTRVSYFGGTLAESQVVVDIGPVPGIILPADSDGAPDFVGSDAVTFSGPITVDTIDESLSDALILADFTGPGSVMLTLTIRELAGLTIPGIDAFQAAYGQGIGVIGLSYEFTPTSPIPEPTTFALLLAGLVALGRRSRAGVARATRGPRR
jgi:hypothetical protein